MRGAVSTVAQSVLPSVNLTGESPAMSSTSVVAVESANDPTVRDEPGTMPASDPILHYRVARSLALEAFDRQYLADVLTRTRGNVTRAAKMAGKERRALGKLIKRYAIQASAYRV
jgi:transcriptional regulator with GAF, ATPase, and Fis domain